MLGLKIVLGIAVVFVVFIFMCLCKVSSVADKHADDIYNMTHRGDNNGDD